MISAVIPHVPLGEEYDDMLKQCKQSLNVDEVIVIVNDMIGFAKAVNQGLALTKEDFICIINNDTEIVKGSVRMLADREAVTYPTVNGDDKNPGCFLCMPRSVYDILGGFEEFDLAYFEDDDFLRRLEEHDIPLRHEPHVEVSHIGGTTIETLKERDDIFDRSQDKYNEKWGSK